MNRIEFYKTQGGQEIFKQILPLGVIIRYEQTTTSNSKFTNNFQVRFYNSKYNNGNAVGLGTISRDGVYWIAKALQTIFCMSEGDFTKFIKESQHMIKDEDDYSITGLSYKEYLLINDFIIKELIE